LRFVVTGGAGFVGGHVALAIAEALEGAEVIAFDSLRRRGSESNLERLRKGGVVFVHGDVRSRSDLDGIGAFDFLVECSADPAVTAVESGRREFSLETNLQGAVHCVEACHRHDAGLLFLSTSRVYPIATLRGARLRETAERFELEAEQSVPGLSEHGVSEAFPLTGARSFYGATKYAAEVVLAEYADAFGLPLVVNRCSVVAGPWQFGLVDQGVLSWWVLQHLRGEPLHYIGFGGTGKQVRDFLHVEDLCRLLLAQLREPERFAGRTFNVGGGAVNRASLRQLTSLCQRATGRRVPVSPLVEDRYADVPVFVTDHRRLTEHCGFAPRHGVERIVEDVAAWLRARPERLHAW
jgi:CDP-paratose 2-epimerase